MKMLAQVLLGAMGGMAVASALADEPLTYGQGFDLLTKYNCQTCHALDKNLSGPSLRAIAKKYASDPNAVNDLEASVVNGSTGVWGPIPMPPTAVPAGDLKRLLKWTLTLNVT
jgi:cytochrome c